MTTFRILKTKIEKWSNFPILHFYAKNLFFCRKIVENYIFFSIFAR